jgi:hypothetical protein
VVDARKEERPRSGSLVPAAFQYLPLVRRFFAEQGVAVLRGPVGRGRDGILRLLVGPWAGIVLDLVAWRQPRRRRPRDPASGPVP